MTAVRVLADWWRHITYRDVRLTHPHAQAALRQLAERRPQDWDPWRNDGRPS